MSALAKEIYYTAEDYFALPEGTRAELIDGVFYDMASPSRRHQRIILRISHLIESQIEKSHPECEVNVGPFAVKPFADRDNFYEPDISVVCDLDKLTDWGCDGAPDWIIEVVSPTNPGHDYVKKLNDYMAAGVREYWIVDPQRERIFVYTDGGDQQYVYSFQDTVKVSVCEGFSIDFRDVDHDNKP